MRHFHWMVKLGCCAADWFAQQICANKLFVYMQRPQILLPSEILHLNLKSITKKLDKIRKKIKREAKCLDFQIRGAENL